MTASKNSILRVQDLSWLWPLFCVHVCAPECVCVSNLALVEVIDNLLVELVLKLPLSGGLVAVSLGQVGCTLLVWPLQRTSKHWGQHCAIQYRAKGEQLTKKNQSLSYSQCKWVRLMYETRLWRYPFVLTVYSIMPFLHSAWRIMRFLTG